MITKPKKPVVKKEVAESSPAAAPSTETPQTTVPSTPGGQTAVPATPAAPVRSTAVASATEPPSTPSFNDPSAFAVGSAREAAVNSMLEMGYPRDQIDAAMRAAFNNPDRAVEYLLSGIPEQHMQEEEEAHAPVPATRGAPATESAPTERNAEDSTTEDVNLFEAAAAAAGGDLGGNADGGQMGNMDLEAIRSSALFQHFRDVVRQQPEMLENLLQQLLQSDPRLALAISSNPDRFARMLEEEVGGDDGLMQDSAEVDGEEVPVTRITVTPEENEAISRLVQLGFDRNVVIQAYFACDKDEQLTANYLFDQHEDDF